jgi:hypothetical protein
MNAKVDIWLRGTDFARTEQLQGIAREPQSWTEDDVRRVLEGMLETMHRLKHPDDDATAVSLRGLSWIVNPFEEGGVVIAIEIGMGAAVAGPFNITQSALESMIARVLVQPPPPTSTTVH